VEARGRLTLHRWCQWISRHHPGGVYDGEEGKRADLAASWPPFILGELLPLLRERGGRAAILAEEWQTADAVLHLDWLLRIAGVRERVTIFWNANNFFGLDRVDWARLPQAAHITTVSRYMRHRLWSRGVDALVVPNGLAPEAFAPPDQEAVAELRRRLRRRIVLTKVARWDPDKRWLLAIDTVAELKRAAWRPILIARGGIEAHGAEVLARAAAMGLRVRDVTMPAATLSDLIDCVGGAVDADVLSLRSPLSRPSCSLLFRTAAAVLANSGHEPFGLVGLEAMAVGGLACTGGTGEDYAIPGWNSLVLQANDPAEFLGHFLRLRNEPAEERALRRQGAVTARRFAWSEVVRRNLLPHLGVAVPGTGRPPARNMQDIAAAGGSAMG
jgi:glycosyltransferase involved in cell wall biosynthesis